MRWLLLLATLIGCATEAQRSRTDDQIVSDTFEAWRARYGMPAHDSRCEAELSKLRIEYRLEPCDAIGLTNVDGCMFYDGAAPRVYLSTAPQAHEPGELLVHELTHWLIACSESMSGQIDADHLHASAWHWAEETAADVAY